MDEAVLSSKDVAVVLDMSPDAVSELARKSLLRGVKKGRQWRFRRRDVVSFQRRAREMAAA